MFGLISVLQNADEPEASTAPAMLLSMLNFNRDFDRHCLEFMRSMARSSSVSSMPPHQSE
jgi:hypothetical protein